VARRRILLILTFATRGIEAGELGDSYFMRVYLRNAIRRLERIIGVEVAPPSSVAAWR